MDRELVDLAGRIARGFFLPGADADDVRQEALIAAHYAATHWRPEHGVELRAFAAYCIRRRLVTALKLAQRQKHRPLNESVRAIANADGEQLDALELVADRRADVAELVEQREQLRRMAAAVAGLSPLERETLADVLSGRRAAAETKSVDNAMQRARAKLRAA